MDVHLAMRSKRRKISGLEIAAKSEAKKINGVSLTLVDTSKERKVDGANIALVADEKNKSVRGLDISGLSDVHEMNGLQIGAVGISNLKGVSLDLLGGVHNGYGVQVGSIFEAYEHFNGIQASLVLCSSHFISSNTPSTKGVQISLFNGGDSFLNRSFSGVRLGIYNGQADAKGVDLGVINNTVSTYGLQAGIFNNIKQEENNNIFRGVQLGLVNRAPEDSQGLQVGVINYRSGAPLYARVIPGFAIRTNGSKPWADPDKEGGKKI